MYAWENLDSWDMCQNGLGQSDCRIFKSTISLEQNDEKVWFFACWYRFMEIKSWLKNIRMSVVINGCVHSGYRNLKLAVSHKEINGINWFLVFWYTFRKAWSYFHNWTRILQRVLQNHGCLFVLPSACPSICQFSIFLRKDRLGFSDFRHDGR